MKGVIVGIVVLLIVVGALYYLYTNGYFYTVNINGVYITYQNNFLIESIQTSYTNTSLSLHGGETFVITLTTKDNGLLPVKITGINVSKPFSIVNTAPSLPVTISHGQNMTFTITVKAPMESYTGSLQIYINGTKVL
ncbi:hypothetical protein [Stygiolobus caldivivus]|uniref:Uncharacterized protein n=1 Tax=Stygiolobus caldivivus TaxID=2824673 RepID=A0A8D5U7B7_9CREN|nr:hypothetical protein [Stygiolobus caldivivus]BCU71050.1 hypothetical protein KN1_23470 [Stygiolobus caldivivus]